MTDNEQLAEIQRKMANLAVELETLRNENRRLRNNVEKSPAYHKITAPRIVNRAHEDAKMLLMLKASGYDVSRRILRDLGVSNRRYAWAFALLRMARIVKRTGYSWEDMDISCALANINAKFECLKNDSTALEKLRLYMPKNLQYMYRSSKR